MTLCRVLGRFGGASFRVWGGLSRVGGEGSVGLSGCVCEEVLCASFGGVAGISCAYGRVLAGVSCSFGKGFTGEGWGVRFRGRFGEKGSGVLGRGEGFW
jgi:hypothetical protein